MLSEKQLFIIKVESVDPDIPGPGTYKTNHMIGKEGWKITMGIGGKNSYINAQQQYAEVPGPGAYNTKTDLNSSGIYYTSNFKNVRSMPYVPTKRFKNEATEVPGPGMYNPKQNHFINLRKSSNQKPFGFGKSKRKSMELDEIINNPGPGSYKLPTTFGSTNNEDEYYQVKLMKDKLSRSMSDQSLLSKSKNRYRLSQIDD